MNVSIMKHERMWLKYISIAQVSVETNFDHAQKAFIISGLVVRSGSML